MDHLTGDSLTDFLVLYGGGAARAFRNTRNLADNPKERNFEDWGTIVTGVNGVLGKDYRWLLHSIAR